MPEQQIALLGTMSAEECAACLQGQIMFGELPEASRLACKLAEEQAQVTPTHNLRSRTERADIYAKCVGMGRDGSR